MIWRVCVAVILCVVMAGSARAQEATEDLLTNTQAADLMSELLTYHGDLAVRRVDAMTAFIGDIGKSQDYRINRPAVPPRKEMTFAEAFKGVIMFVKQGGARLADPVLAKMTPDQLSRELDALQHYNLQQFLYLNTQRDDIARMKVYLSSIGQFDAYEQWAATHAPRTANILTTAPTTQDAKAIAGWLSAQVGAVKARTWEKAKAKGMTREQFDLEWNQKEQALKDDLRQRIDAVKKLGEYFAPRPALPEPAAPGTPGASWAAQGAVTIAPRATPGAPDSGATGAGQPVDSGTPLTANDPRWQQSYYGPNKFNGWNDDYSDVFQPNGGGGAYRRYDTRVNNDNDARVNGEIDRRANISADRRQNIRIDPRVNY